MGIYNFKSRFVPAILAGTKTHTIRAPRIHPDKPGNTLHLYTGLRTKNVKLLMRVPCVKIEQITIIELQVHLNAIFKFRIYIDGILLSTDEVRALARRDGFASFSEMMAFWKGRLPFEGQVIHWRNS